MATEAPDPSRKAITTSGPRDGSSQKFNKAELRGSRHHIDGGDEAVTVSFRRANLRLVELKHGLGERREDAFSSQPASHELMLVADLDARERTGLRG